MSTINQKTKVCSFCKISKNISEFSKQSRAKDGHINQCKKCINLIYKLREQKKKSLIREQNREFYLGLSNKKEQWKDVVGYEGIYLVSSLAKVVSLVSSTPHCGPRILTPRDNGRGYLRVGLTKNGLSKKHSIHRLVGIAFLPNPLNLSDVNHIDEDPYNNKLNNLEWMSHIDNVNFGNGIQKRVETVSRKVWRYKDGVLIDTWKSVMELHRNGWFSSGVCDCCNGKRKTYRGFVFSYHEVK